MKFTKKTKTIAGVTAGIIVIAVIIAAALITGRASPEPSPTPEYGHLESTEPLPDVVVSIAPDKPSDAPTDEPEEAPANTEKEAAALVIDVGGDPDPKPEPPKNSNAGGGNTVKPPAPEKSVKPKKPDPTAKPSKKDDGGITIGGDDGQSDKPYSCGTKKHKCAGPETHAFITNLEIQGCSTCGSKSCASFYALDKWGSTSYDPSKCPQYKKKDDPLLYCQDCGKKTGSGQNGTCVKFVDAAKCPECGVKVPSRTCHTCK